jgi:signal transduction histidine kinase/DNA-binding response OmpR family regulator/HAMP domain-containing protein
MRLKNLKIGTQLRVGFAAMLFFVVVLGSISYQQSAKIHLQTKTMYNHPVLVRRAIGLLSSDILGIQVNIKDLFLSSDEKEIAFNLSQIELRNANSFEQISLIYTSYLGPVNDVDSVKKAFIIWKSTCDETVHLFRDKKIQEAASRAKAFGICGRNAVMALDALQKIDDFARNKGDELYTASIELNNSLKNQLFLLIAAILLLSVLIYTILLRAVSKPIDELTQATKRFHEGDLNARSSNTSKNEFGALSASFNKMVENIQLKTDLDEKFAALASLMLSEYDIKKFFQSTLNALAEYTSSQIAVIYLLSDNKKSFDHFESIGLDHNARQSFAADLFEGEFGAVLSTRKIQHLKNIPEDTRFIFHTVSCKLIPREIITIPILADNQVVAVISLASVSQYSHQTIQLADRILVTLCARIEGILSYHKMKEFSAALELQNRELETQKSELASQSVELIEQNTELEIQKNQLDEASRLKTNFLSNMSHELRTPLNSVIALSGVLNRRLSKQIPDEEYSYLEVIERNGKHLLNLINDILDISRIEAGREEIEITTFNLCNLVNEVIDMIGPQADLKKIELFKVVGDGDVSITSDATKCRHIVQNLISNAVKFTDRGKVEIRIQSTNKSITMSVTDTGIGISEDHLSHIFDEFRQADSSTSRRFGGTGLGLAIAKKYANLLGGSIQVKSNIGIGSEFLLTLPFTFAAQSVISEAEELTGFNQSVNQTQYISDLKNSIKTILLVEDSEPSIIQMKDFLEESGCKILVARNGEEALDIIGCTVPDAMILDLMMPGIDGFEVLRNLREAESTAHVPVLILTAKHITKEELQFLKRNNVHQLIQKGGVNRNDLIKAIAAMITPKTVPLAPQVRELQAIDGRPNILVVEDNTDNMITLKAILDGNFTVIEATDGTMAIELANKHLPHLILMDIELPGLDGISAFKVIRKNPSLKHIPVVAVTASAMTSDRETILAHGFDAYIAKPIDTQSFLTTINEVLYGK